MNMRSTIAVAVGTVFVSYAVVFGKAKELHDGTVGYRFKFLGVTGVWRKRGELKRSGVTEGKTTRGYHSGKSSLYIEKRKRNRHEFGKTFCG